VLQLHILHIASATVKVLLLHILHINSFDVFQAVFSLKNEAAAIEKKNNKP
jgi:hypothetical protein